MTFSPENVIRGSPSLKGIHYRISLCLIFHIIPTLSYISQLLLLHIQQLIWMKICFDSSCLRKGYIKTLECEASLLFRSFFREMAKERIETWSRPLSFNVYPYILWQLPSIREEEREPEVTDKRGLGVGNKYGEKIIKNKIFT